MYKSAPIVQKRVCNAYTLYIPTELPFCIPSLLVGYAFSMVMINDRKILLF